ncbi:MAG: lysophospholipid acyltransferase family protein [Thermodesulfobacteriota bacterium]
MISLFHRILVSLSRKLGIWVFSTSAWVIASCYFLFFPARVANSVRFYQALFPHRTLCYAVYCAWKQFHDFTNIYIDRHHLESAGKISYTVQGWEHLAHAAQNKTGGILLMSHLGNWEVAARLLQKQGIPLLLFMGQKAGEQLEGLQKSALKQEGAHVIASLQGQGSPAQILEGLRYLRSGWMLSLAGDRSLNPKDSRVEASFLGHLVSLPQTPYALALASGAPIFVFFAFRTGRQQYHFVIHPPIYLQAAARSQRKECIRQAAQQYADLLQQAVHDYPFEWHHFQPFLGPRKSNPNPAP